MPPLSTFYPNAPRQVGLAWDSGSPLLLEPGRVYNVDSPRFAYDGSRWVTEPIIEHGR